MTFIDRAIAAAGILVGKTYGLGRFFDRPPMMDGLETRLHEPYKQSAWVRSAINAVAGPIAAVPLRFSEDASGRQLLDDPALSAWWKNPAQCMTRDDFILATVGWIKLKGEAFWVLDDTWLLPFPNVAKLGKILLVRPKAMREIVTNGQLQGWEMTDKVGQHTILLPEQVIQLKSWNPYNDFRGLGDMDAAELAAQTDHAASTFARNLMLNNGDKGAIVSAKNGQLSDEQSKQIETQLRLKRELQRRGNFAPIFLSNDVSVQDPAIQSPDATFATNRLYNRHEIYITFGVPASMADVVSSYSVGSASDRFRLIEETCMPLASRIAAAIGRLATIQRGRETTASFGWDEHSVMQQVRRERIEGATKMWATGIPWRTLNDWMGLGLPHFDGDSTAYLPFSVSPVGTSASVETSPDYAEPTQAPDNALDQIGAAFRTRNGAVSDDPVDRIAAAFRARAARAPQSKVSDADRALWRVHMERRRQTKADYSGRVTRWIFGLRGEVLKNLERKGEKSVIQRGAAADFLFDLDDATATFKAAMRKAGEAALNTAGTQLVKDELGRDDPWKMADPKITEFLDARENKMSGIPEEVHKTMMDTLSEGIDNGETMADLQGRIRAACNGMSKSTAERIAQTETAAAYGTARQAAMTDAGVSRKRWLTSGNDNVRLAHAEANGQEVGTDEPFEVGGEELMCPGDEDGSPENVINCHCISIPVA